MALVMSPWFGRGCGRRARPFSFGSPSLFSDLVIIKVPVQQRQASVAPPVAAMSNTRVVQWTETADAHIFKLRLPGLKKEDLQIQVEDRDRTLYISCSNQQQQAKEKTVKFKDDDAANLNKEGEATSTPDSQRKEQNNAPTGTGSNFMRKFKLPETADLEQITAYVTCETLTVTVPKLKAQAAREPRTIEIQGGATAASSQPEALGAEKSGDAKASTSTA